jgi:F-type H+-transporting ATPase subunit delta
MDAGTISTRYARAIYAYAAEKGKETALYEGMRYLTKNFAQFPTLRGIMSDPTLTAEQKIEVLDTAADVHLNETLQQVIRLVVKNKRSNRIENIALMYDQVYRKAKGIVTVGLTTVEPASEKMQEDLISVIAQVTDKKVEFQAKTDSGIIGGYILEIEDKRLDASVKEQLRIISYEL